MAKPAGSELIEDMCLQSLEWKIRESLGERGEEVLSRLMDSLSEYYGVQEQGFTNEVNRFKVAIRGTPTGLQNLFVESINKQNIVFALALFRAKPEAIGAELFAEHFGAILVYIMESGCWVSLDMVWPWLPTSIKEMLGEKLPDIWWAKGHHDSAVIIAQGDKVSVTNALFFALRIGAEYPEWSELIVQKQCEREERRV